MNLIYAVFIFNPDVVSQTDFSNNGGSLDLKVSPTQELYRSRNSKGLRFIGNFSNNIKLDLTPEAVNTFTAGNNLTYLFDQSDESNKNYPIVFSTSKNDYLTKLLKLEQKQRVTPGKPIFTQVTYFLDHEEVTYQKYINLTDFNNATTRTAQIIVETSFDPSYIKEKDYPDIYYGFYYEDDLKTRNSEGYLHGGRFNIIYH